MALNISLKPIRSPGETAYSTYDRVNEPKAFVEVANADPTCAMAYWGMAMSRRTNPLVGAPDHVALQEGLDGISKAKAAAAKTQRERDYIGAIETYYEDWEKRDYQTRVLAYESAME